MVELEILTAMDQHGDEVVWEPLAHLRVDNATYDLDDAQGVIDFRVPLVSLRTGTEVRFEDDREEWARSLPTAFRTGDVIVRVLHDDNPVRENELSVKDVERHQVQLRERLGHVVH
jgi:hypothetical protein